MAMANKIPTVCEYVLQRLADLGIDRVFGVPGDYSFPIDDAIETTPGLEWVVCANELNAAYAADGYARRRGAAILTTTYGVGELSAINGVMGARAHSLPIFHVVGQPSLRIQKRRLVTHHTLGDGTYGNFIPLSAATACVHAQLTPDNAIVEMERVIAEALRQSAPAYITIPQDQQCMPVVGTPIKGRPLASVKRHASAPDELAGALAEVLDRLKQAKRPVLLPTAAIARYGLQAKVTALLDRTRIPFALSPMDKGVLDEAHPGYLGLYAGEASAPAAVRQAVEEADLILDLGGLVFEDLNTGYWSDRLGDDRLITLGASFVEAGGKLFTAATLTDMVDGLLAAAPVFDRLPQPEKTLTDLAGAPGDRLGAASFYPRLQRLLRQGDVLVIETGTASAILPKLLLPAGVSCESQTLWGSIGWATPATLGVAMADLSRRAVLVTGDGAHQLTANEIGVMGRYGIKPLIFVLNNGIYGVEDVLSERGHVYDDIAPWNYHAVPAAMGCKGWFTARVATVAELEQAIATAQAHDGGCYIEVMIPETESQPIPRAMIDRIYKAPTPR